LATPLSAQQGIDSVIKERSYNFGVVARNAKLRHSFEVTNPYDQPLHIAEVKPGCGCTAAVVGATTIPPGGKTYIEGILNTRNFTGVKNSGLTVTFDQPYSMQVSLGISAFIRGDVVIDPEQIDFGAVTRGKTATQAITVAYAGRSDWRIERVVSANPAIRAEAREIRREGDRIDYQVVATLEPTSAGYLKDIVTIVTNDTGTRTVPVTVLAQIQSNLTLSPTMLSLGNLTPGQTIERKLVVRGNQPFKIVRIDGQTEDWSAESSEDSKTLHVVTIRYKAADAAEGTVQHRFRIVTDLKGESPLDAFAVAKVGS